MPDAASVLLLRAGVLGPQSLAAAKALRQREGGTLGEALVRLGAIDEEHLVAAFHQALGVPVVPAAALEEVHAVVLQFVPAHLAVEHRVVPVGLSPEGELILAMAEPTDERAVQEVEAHTGRTVKRSVAAPSSIRDALVRGYGVVLPRPEPPLPQSVTDLLSPEVPAEPPVEAPPSQPGRPRRTTKRTTRPKAVRAAVTEKTPEKVLDKTPEPTVTALARAVQSGEDVPAKARRLQQGQRRATSRPARESGAAGLGKAVGSAQPAHVEGGTVSDPILLDREAPRVPRFGGDRASADAGQSSFGPHSTLPGLGVAAELLAPVALLRAAPTRDEVVKVLLDYAARLAARVGLFVVQRGQLSCLDGRGPEDVVMAMKWISLAVDEPSPFRDVLRSRQPFIGTLLDTAAGRAFRSAIGAVEGDALLLPLVVGERAVGVLYADELRADLGQLQRELATLSQEAGGALMRIILMKKRASAT